MGSQQIRRVYIRLKEVVDGIWFLLIAFWTPSRSLSMRHPDPRIPPIGLPAHPAHHMPNPRLLPLCGWFPVPDLEGNREHKCWWGACAESRPGCWGRGETTNLNCRDTFSEKRETYLGGKISRP